IRPAPSLLLAGATRSNQNLRPSTHTTFYPQGLRRCTYLSRVSHKYHHLEKTHSTGHPKEATQRMEHRPAGADHTSATQYSRTKHTRKTVMSEQMLVASNLTAMRTQASMGMRLHISRTVAFLASRTIRGVGQRKWILLTGIPQILEAHRITIRPWVAC